MAFIMTINSTCELYASIQFPFYVVQIIRCSVIGKNAWLIPASFSLEVKKVWDVGIEVEVLKLGH